MSFAKFGELLVIFLQYFLKPSFLFLCHSYDMNIRSFVMASLIPEALSFPLPAPSNLVFVFLLVRWVISIVLSSFSLIYFFSVPSVLLFRPASKFLL
jgi:hypothetical protein